MGSEGDRQLLIAFNMIPGIGGRRLQGLIECFGNLQKAWAASPQQLAAVPGFGPKLAESVAHCRQSIDPVRELQLAKAEGVDIITLDSSSYPVHLKQIAVPPPVLYCRGTLPAVPGLAIVGTRRPSAAGRRQAHYFAAAIGSVVPIVSGLARGIDYQAHKGCLDKGGITVAVLGSYIGKMYPREHQGLADQIAENGCLISEFSSNAPIHPSNFIRRNRIISGLSTGVLVVEAGKRSGALNTAAWAVEQNREVWAIPGDIFSPQKQGVHSLIKEGAALVDKPEDILVQLRDLGSTEVSVSGKDETIRQLYNLGCSADEIANQSGISIPEVMRAITNIQLGM